MKITILAGSHRINSQSERIAKYLEKELPQLGMTPHLVSLAGNPLPMWDEGLWGDDPKWKQLWSPIAKEIQSSDGLIVVTPEWSGMVPSGVKNFFLLCSTRELGHKAGLIVSVSSGMGGSYPITELRQSSYKNTRLCYIPDHIIVRNCENVLKEQNPTDEHDISLRKRITYTLRLFGEYGKALNAVRESGVINYKDFPFGV